MIDIEGLENFIGARVAQLRTIKKVSAREMSLAIGQGEAYINNIENRKTLPSITGFLYICEYFNIHPKDFFDVDSASPEKLNEVIKDMKALTPEQLDNIARVIKDVKK